MSARWTRLDLPMRSCASLSLTAPLSTQNPDLNHAIKLGQLRSHLLGFAKAKMQSLSQRENLD
jgi:hypothetical protein